MFLGEGHVSNVSSCTVWSLTIFFIDNKLDFLRIIW